MHSVGMDDGILHIFCDLNCFESSAISLNGPIDTPDHEWITSNFPNKYADFPGTVPDSC